VKQPEQDSSQRLQQDSLHLLRQDWSLRLALQVDLRLEVVRVLLAAVAVAAPAASSSQVLVVRAPGSSQAAAALRPDSSVPEQLDSYLLLPAALVPEAELVQAKPTRTRVNRDR
jgi:hypothetical protein